MREDQYALAALCSAGEDVGEHNRLACAGRRNEKHAPAPAFVGVANAIDRVADVGCGAIENAMPTEPRNAPSIAAATVPE